MRSYRQEVEIGAGDTTLRVRVQHGGRIAFDVHDQNGLRLVGTVHLVTSDGAEITPQFYSQQNGLGHPAGRLFGNEASVTFDNLATGTYQVVLDLGPHGIHRRSVEVKVCEVTELKFTVP